MTRPETARYFTCHGCGGIFQAVNTDLDVAVEMLRNFGEITPDRVSVCDGCYESLMARARQDGRI